MRTLLRKFDRSNKSEVNFVLSSWKKSARVGAYEHWSDVKWREMCGVIEGLVEEEELEVMCNPAEEDQIFGWICVNRGRDILWYVYVKQLFRGQGLAKEMCVSVGAMNSDSAFWHPAAVRARRREWVYTYNPYLLEEGRTKEEQR